MERVLHLLVLLLALSHLVVSSEPIPVSNKETKYLPTIGEPLKSQLVADEATAEEDVIGGGRMDIEINDYPGSGANNRHTPKPPARS